LKWIGYFFTYPKAIGKVVKIRRNTTLTSDNDIVSDVTVSGYLLVTVPACTG